MPPIIFRPRNFVEITPAKSLPSCWVCEDRSVESSWCNLAVDEGHKRKGIASALVRDGEEKVQAWHSATDGNIPNSLYLKVRQSNKAAVLMYDQLGYRSYMQEADIKGEVVLVMRKSLHASRQEMMGSEPTKPPSRK